MEPERLERLGAIFREGLQLIKEIQRNHEVEEKVQQALRQQQRPSELSIASSPVLQTTPTISLGAPASFLSSRLSNSIAQESSLSPSIFLATLSTLSPHQSGSSISSSSAVESLASLLSRPLDQTGNSHKRGPPAAVDGNGERGGEEQAKRLKTDETPSNHLQRPQGRGEETASSEVSPNSSSSFYATVARSSRPQPPPTSEESREAILRAFAEWLQQLDYPKPRIGKYLRFVNKIVFDREEITESDLRSGARSAVDAYEWFRGAAAASASPSPQGLEALSNHSDTSPEMGSP